MLRVNAINRQELLKCLTFNPKSLVFKTVSVPLLPMEGRNENPGFMKTHMQELLEEKMYEIREIFNQYLNDEEEKH